MTSTLVPWELRVHRGPNWLLVQAICPDQAVVADGSLADQLWALMDQHFTYRLILRLDRKAELDGQLLQQLISLDDHARAHDGCVRLCALSPFQRQQLRHAGHRALYNLLPIYDDIQDAVFGDYRPRSKAKVAIS
jgi:hypothetical protein